MRFFQSLIKHCVFLGNKLASVRAMRMVVPMDCDVCNSRYFNAGTFCIWSKIHQVQLEMWKVSWFCCLVVFSAVVFMDFPHFALYQSREKEPAGAIGNARNFAEKFHPRGNFHRRTAGWKSWGNFRERIVILCSSSGSRESNNATRNMLPQIRFPSCFPLFPQSWRESKRQLQMPVSGWGGRGDGVRQCRLLTFSNEFHHAQTCRADTCHRTIHRDSANLLSMQKKSGRLLNFSWNSCC